MSTRRFKVTEITYLDIPLDNFEDIELEEMEETVLIFLGETRAEVDETKVEEVNGPTQGCTTCGYTICLSCLDFLQQNEQENHGEFPTVGIVNNNEEVFPKV